MTDNDGGLSLEALRALLAERVAGGVLTAGRHEAPAAGAATCDACVRELRALALGLPWSDHPDSPRARGVRHVPGKLDEVCQLLNDAAWSSDTARTEGCLPLALLSQHTAPSGWLERFVERLNREVRPAVSGVAATVWDAVDYDPGAAVNLCSPHIENREKRDRLLGRACGILVEVASQ